MAAFINICFDVDTTNRIASFQQTLADSGISDYAAWLGYPPHITLARLDGAQPETLIPAATRVLTQLRTVKIGLGALALFGGNEPVVWIAPVPNLALLDAHRQLCIDLEPLSVHEHYRPLSWMPHVTLAAGLDRNKAVAAISALLPDFSPMVVIPSRIEVVSFPPAQVLWSEKNVP
jgi:2'-5' RNA ligase